MQRWEWCPCGPLASGEVSCVVLTELTRKPPSPGVCQKKPPWGSAGWPLREREGGRGRGRAVRTERDGDSPGMRHPGPVPLRVSRAPSADAAHHCTPGAVPVVQVRGGPLRWICS